MTTKLCDEIEYYYQQRGLIRPSLWHAFAFLVEEIGEVSEELMIYTGGYKRNNLLKEVRQSDEEHIRAIGEELGDVIMMAVMTGRTLGIDPILCLKAKMERKIAGG
jgi:NTP pyrophosphatase (non-canonical NTP hydrolase)